MLVISQAPTVRRLRDSPGLSEEPIGIGHLEAVPGRGEDLPAVPAVTIIQAIGAKARGAYSDQKGPIGPNRP